MYKRQGYSSTLLALMIMGIGYGQKYGSMDQESCRNILEELRLCVKRLDRTMERTMDWCSRYGKDWKMQDLYVLGTGMNYGTAMEGQLKLCLLYTSKPADSRTGKPVCTLC